MSERVGKKRATVANYLRLLKLPAPVQVAIQNHKIDTGHARALLALDDPKDQVKLFKECQQILTKEAASTNSKKFRICLLAVLLAAVGRYAMAVLSGTVFFAEYAGDQNALVYSLVYNISYIGPDVLVCMIVSCIPGMARLVDVIRGRKA